MYSATIYIKIIISKFSSFLSVKCSNPDISDIISILFFTLKLKNINNTNPCYSILFTQNNNNVDYKKSLNLESKYDIYLFYKEYTSVKLRSNDISSLLYNDHINFIEIRFYVDNVNILKIPKFKYLSRNKINNFIKSQFRTEAKKFNLY